MDLKLYYDGAIEALFGNVVAIVEEFIKQCEYVVIGTAMQQGGYTFISFE